jgi:hypothetical protein
MHLQLIDETQAMIDEENSNGSKSNSETKCEWNNANNMDV